MKQVEVVAAVIYKDNNIFITKRSGGQFDGLWEFPGGKIEQGETHIQTVTREIKEELDIEIEVKGYLTTVHYNYPNFALTMHLYWAQITEGTPKLLEHAEAQWLNKRALKNVDWIPADIAVIEAINKSNFP